MKLYSALFVMSAALVSAAYAVPTVTAVTDIASGDPYVGLATDFSGGFLNPDCEAMASNGTRVFYVNGGDTDDGDGDGIVSFPPSAPFLSTQAIVYTTGSVAGTDTAASQSIEGALLTGGWTAINGGGETVRGFDVDASGNVYLAFDNTGRGALLRVESTSTLTTAAITFLAGGDGAGNPVDGVSDIAVIGNFVYVLQDADFGAPENRIVRFNTTGTGQTGTVVVSAADLTTVGFNLVTDNIGFGFLTASANTLYFGTSSTGTNGGVARWAVDSGTGAVTLPGTLVAPYSTLTTAATSAGLTLGGLSTGGAAVDPATGNLYIQSFDSVATANDATFIMLLQPTGVASIFITEAQIEASSAFTTNISGGEVEGPQPQSLAIAGGHLYMSLETTTSNTDSIIRMPLPPASVSDWTVY